MSQRMSASTVQTTVVRAAHSTTGNRFGDQAFAMVIGAALLPLALFAGRHLGSDANYDLLSYHSYIGEAALSGRLGSDVAPAGLGSFHNPLLDLPGALALRQSVRLFTVWLAIQQWVCWLALWGFVRTVLRERDRPAQLLCLAVALTGSAAMSLSITSFGDWPVAALLLASLTVVLNSHHNARGTSPQPDRRRLVVGGLLAALALAAKLTAAPFLIGLTVAVVVVAGRRAWLWAGGFVAGIAALCLPWWIYLTNRFGNPFFPYYNKIFKSEDGPVSSFDDSRFGTSSLQDLVRLPIDFARGTTRYSELVYRDLRWVGVVAALVAWLAVAGGTTHERKTWRAIGVFGFLGYVLWLVPFGIYRYGLVLELMASVFIVSVISMLKPRVPAAAVGIAMTVALAVQTSPNWGRATPLHVKLPLLGSELRSERRSERVLLADMGPTSYLVRSLPPGTPLASIQGFAFGFFSIDGQLGESLRKFVADGMADSSLRIIINPATELQPIVAQLGIAPNLAACQGFAGPFGPLAICPVVPVSL